jgi:predicted XRE-type DNA-binding protein
MCIIYNTIGSIKTIKAHLEEHRINDFASLKEVLDFQNAYPHLKSELVATHTAHIDQEKAGLYEELQQLDHTIKTHQLQIEQTYLPDIDRLKQQLQELTCLPSAHVLQRIKHYFIRRNVKNNLRSQEHRYRSEVKNTIKQWKETQRLKQQRYQWLLSHTEEAVEQLVQQSLAQLERKKTVIDRISSHIYGAIGEQKVVHTLESLSDDYFLINDFAVSFSPAIYHKKQQEYIKSIQIDHVLVAPSGIFLIETKNWSEASLDNISLRSPVEQLRRSGFAFFTLLNNDKRHVPLFLNKHHWGDKKIPIKSLIVFINSKPKEEFKFVKILTLKELTGYIQYFEPVFSVEETRHVAEFLVQWAERNPR